MWFFFMEVIILLLKLLVKLYGKFNIGCYVVREDVVGDFFWIV